MPESNIIGHNIARLRADRDLSQADVADKAGISRLALGKIERGEVIPRSKTLEDLAAALNASVAELVTAVRPLETVRFRARSRLHGREQILAEVSRWLEAYCWLEKELNQELEPALPNVVPPPPPEDLAQATRKSFRIKEDEPVRDICGLLEDKGIKVLLLPKSTDAFFGLSIGKKDGGPAVVVNLWNRISVERWIFTAAHELGHLLLHRQEYKREETTEPEHTEREADAFASHFLMPEKVFASEWEETSGQPLVYRVLKVKRIFHVSYRTVLYRLVETGCATKDVWQAFQIQHKHYYGKTLKKADEPGVQADKREFAWSWNRAAEPDALSENDFREDRLSRLVRHALEKEVISLGRAAEILGLSREEMRRRARDWVA